MSILSARERRPRQRSAAGSELVSKRSCGLPACHATGKPAGYVASTKKRTDRCKNPTECGGKLAYAPSPIELGPPPQALSCRRRRSPGGHCVHSTLTRYRYSRPPRAPPILLGFPLHRRCIRILALDPVRRASRTIGRVAPLRPNALESHLAGVLEN